MTVILVIAGWFLISTVCTPLIGRFLHAVDLQPAPAMHQVKARSVFAAQSARRETHHRRATMHAWPRKTLHQPRTS